MVRINLLPREIQERRRWERWYPYLGVAAVVGLVVVLAAFALLQFMVVQKSKELQQTEETTAQLQREATAFAVFEQKEQQLQARQGVAHQALTGRFDMGKIAEEVSMVVPDEWWLMAYLCNQSTGLVLDGFTPTGSQSSMKVGYKSIAAGLVRLNALPDLFDVWLTRAAMEPFQFPSNVSGGGTVDSVHFGITSKVMTPTASPVPAPPATSGTQ